jgi:excisionase family DNA binding protein
MEELITIKDASEIMGITHTMVSYLIRDNQLPALKYGYRTFRIRKKELEEFIKSRETKKNAKYEWNQSNGNDGLCNEDQLPLL